jgi:hypothetical protein
MQLATILLTSGLETRPVKVGEATAQCSIGFQHVFFADRATTLRHYRVLADFTGRAESTLGTGWKPMLL